MNPFLSRLGRFLPTLALVCAAGVVAHGLWLYYMDAPWTRDGRIRADVVRVAPDVSGLVERVSVTDNAHVKKGDLLFAIDGTRFKLALEQAEAAVASAEAVQRQAQRDLDRYRQLTETAVSRQKMEEVTTAAAQAEAAAQKARADRDLARLNLDRSQVRAPVNGVITNFTLQPGNYVAAGQAVTALVDDDSYHVQGYFEETKLDRIHVGDRAVMRLMGASTPIEGHVVSIAAAIEDRDRTDSANLLANVNPTFSWVRLAQRVPVRVSIDAVPDDVKVVAGRTVSVSIVN
ncbi:MULTISPECIES: efflux RND transporter periplasmic adaptor subunit [unclassified Xanthobacter]|uniref:efflux RND transporter periplasmic adaptor subunit n=1 Tax=unclassified Xanthobacter TaxID=2623496 RepID=UPI001EDF6F67|nr:MULTISPECIES: HlyD family secretion protein [unclassified Xanthobacter]